MFILLTKIILFVHSQFGLIFIRNGNRAGLGWVVPIPTSPRLFKTNPIPVPFKKLNGTGRGRTGMINSHTRPALPRLTFIFLIHNWNQRERAYFSKLTVIKNHWNSTLKRKFAAEIEKVLTPVPVDNEGSRPEKRQSSGSSPSMAATGLFLSPGSPTGSDVSEIGFPVVSSPTLYQPVARTRAVQVPP